MYTEPHRLHFTALRTHPDGHVVAVLFAVDHDHVDHERHQQRYDKQRCQRERTTVQPLGR